MRKLFILFKDNFSVMATIKSQPTAVGGEGYIYRIKFPQHGLCVLKLYKNKEKADRNREKIFSLINGEVPKSNNPNLRFCWPIGIAYEENRTDFAGFIMPEAFPNSQDLYILEDYEVGASIKDKYPDDIGWHEKYELNTKRGLRNRLAVLHNWAAALAVIHKTGQYVLGDIKPTNVMVEPSQGKVSIIDIDSCQVSINGVVKFSRTAQTPSHRPPEITSRLVNNPIGEDYDSFSFAVSAYTILTGTHPYSNCMLLTPYNTEEFANIVSCMKAGLSPVGRNSHYTKRIIGYDLHKNLERLPASLQKLFLIAFKSVNRPHFSEWKEAIKQAIIYLDRQ